MQNIFQNIHSTIASIASCGSNVCTNRFIFIHEPLQNLLACFSASLLAYQHESLLAYLSARMLFSLPA